MPSFALRTNRRPAAPPASRRLASSALGAAAPTSVRYAYSNYPQ